ncbi:hypothetical protein SEA_XENIA2_64 [Gordonia phage Xenia2]
MPRGSKKCQPDCKCGKHAFKGAANHKWTGDKPTFGAMHQRLRREFGPARDYLCNDCDGLAKEWSKIHDREGYDLDDYEPRCGPCHAKYDYDIVHNPEVVTRRQETRKGYRHSEETKKKIGESRKRFNENSKTTVLLKRKTGVS